LDEIQNIQKSLRCLRVNTKHAAATLHPASSRGVGESEDYA
jgi:hypothetical protein